MVTPNKAELKLQQCFKKSEDVSYIISMHWKFYPLKRCTLAWLDWAIDLTNLGIY